jgi:hypothetical protein
MLVGLAEGFQRRDKILVAMIRGWQLRIALRCRLTGPAKCDAQRQKELWKYAHAALDGRNNSMLYYVNQ